MAVTVVDFVQQEWNTDRVATLTLGGLSSGQMAIAESSHSDSDHKLPSGWTYAGGEIWWRILTAGDLTEGTMSVTIRGSLTSLTVLSGAAGLGRLTQQAQVRVSGAAGAFFRGRTDRYRDDLAPATYRLGAETVSEYDRHRHAVYFRAGGPGYVWLPDVDDDAGFRAFEVLVPAAPSAPVSLLPYSGTNVDKDKQVALSFAHQSSTQQPQTACAVRIRVSGGTWGSIRSDGTIAAGDTSQVLQQTSGTVYIAAGQLTAGSQYEWVPYTQDTAGWSPAGAAFTLVARAVPTAVVSLSTTPEDLSPLITATVTPGTGSLQAWRVRVCPAASGEATLDAAVWDSGQITGSGPVSIQAAPGSAWENGGSYRAWVLPTDSALTGAWSASDPATVSWTTPQAPSSVTASPGSPVSVLVFGVPSGSELVEISASSGSGWGLIASVNSPLSSVTVSHPLAPYGIPTQYRARALAIVDGVLLPSAWVVSAAVTNTDLSAYVVSEDQSCWIRVRLAEAGASTPIQGVASFGCLGEVSLRVDRTPVLGRRGWWTAETRTLDEEEELISWLTDPDKPSFWLRACPERSYDGALAGVPSVLTSVEEAPAPERRIQGNLSPRRIRWGWVCG